MFKTPFFTELSNLLASIRGAPDAAAQAQQVANSAGQMATQAKQTADNTKTLADGLAATQVRTYQVQTGQDGKVIVDYTNLQLSAGTKPRVVFMVKLPSGAMPVVSNIEGDATHQQVTIRCMRLQSLLSLGNLTLGNYVGVSGINIDVYVRPVA